MTMERSSGEDDAPGSRGPTAPGVHHTDRRGANALRRLVDVIETPGPDWPPIRVGGVVTSVSPDRMVVAGLVNRLALSETVLIEGASGPARAEIVRIGADGATAKSIDASPQARVGAIAWRDGPIAIAPCEGWLGRVVDALGTAIDGGPPLAATGRARPVGAPPPPALARGRPDVPTRTGVRAIDIFAPIVRGQRVGVFAGSGVGKSTLVAMMAAASDFDMVVLGLTGERGREVRAFVEDALGHARASAVTVVATADESAVRRRLAPLTAMTVAEAFRDEGRHVLLVVDSLTRYAHAIREIALDAGEMPVARGYPPSLFGELPRYLERAGPGRDGGGSITAVFTVLVDGGDLDEPVADTARGSLDGHIVLSRAIAEAGRYPAIDVLASLSRLADRAWTGEQRHLVQRLRAMIRLFEDTRDLRAMGVDGADRDPDLQQAVALVPRIYDALRQSPADPPSSDPYAELAALLRPAQPPSPRA